MKSKQKAEFGMTSKAVQVEFKVPFPYNNREVFFEGSAYDLLFERNTIMVLSKSIDNDNELFQTLEYQKNNKKNVMMKVFYLGGRQKILFKKIYISLSFKRIIIRKKYFLINLF